MDNHLGRSYLERERTEKIQLMKTIGFLLAFYLALLVTFCSIYHGTSCYQLWWQESLCLVGNGSSLGRM